MTVMVVCPKVAHCSRFAARKTVRDGLLPSVRSAQAAAGRRSGKTAGRGKRARRANNRKSWHLSLKPFAGVGVAYAQDEEAKAEGQHDDVPHDKCSLPRLFRGATCARSGESGLGWINRRTEQRSRPYPYQ